MEGQIKCFPDKVKLKEFIIITHLLHEMLKGLSKKKKKMKSTNTTMTTNSHLSTTESKQSNKNKLSKQLEQELNHRNGGHVEGYQLGGRGGEWEEGTRNKKHKW